MAATAPLQHRCRRRGTPQRRAIVGEAEEGRRSRGASL